MNKRIDISKVEPEAWKAIMALENYTKTIPLDHKLKELLKIRASQINHCAYCIDMHTDIALKYGETARRIFALSAWRESHLFTEQEKALLQLTEEITLIGDHGVREETYSEVLKFYEEKTMAQVIMLLVLINSWNRIMVTSGGIYKEA